MKAVWSQLLWTPRTRSKWNLALGYVTMLLFLQLLAFFLFGFCHRNSCMRHKDVAMAMTTAMACPGRLSALLTYVLLAFCGAALRKRMLSCCCQLPGVFIVALLQSQNPPKARGPENPLAHHPPNAADSEHLFYVCLASSVTLLKFLRKTLALSVRRKMRMLPEFQFQHQRRRVWSVFWRPENPWKLSGYSSHAAHTHTPAKKKKNGEKSCEKQPTQRNLRTINETSA